MGLRYAFAFFKKNFLLFWGLFSPLLYLFLAPQLWQTSRRPAVQRCLWGCLPWGRMPFAKLTATSYDITTLSIVVLLTELPVVCLLEGFPPGCGCSVLVQHSGCATSILSARFSFIRVCWAPDLAFLNDGGWSGGDDGS